MRRLPTPTTGDLVAGISVALVLLPQSLAYAEIAGVPPHVGLFAAALPPLLAAPFVSSPYLQTGPVALTSLLTFGALSGLETTGTAPYVELAALLALIVGVARAVLGLLRVGIVAYVMSQPVLTGFTGGAAILIVASQVPSMFDADPDADGVMEEALWVLLRPSEWDMTAVVLSVTTVLVVVGGRRAHRLFPGVLTAVVAAVVWSEWSDYDGTVVGDLPGGFITLSLGLPYGQIPSLLVAGIVIALVGFAEPASIARTFATADRTPWSANRELLGQGVANIASGISGGFPVGGSFSRSSLNRFAGAQTQWSGAITGAFALAAIPLSATLESLPTAVLGAIVLTAVYRLIDVPAMLQIARGSGLQGLVVFGTFAATLISAPNVERGVIAGVGLAFIVHLIRELRVDHRHEVEDGTLVLRPHGVIWFVTAPHLETSFIAARAEHPQLQNLRIDFANVGRVDYGGAAKLAELVDDAVDAGLNVDIVNIAPHAKRAMAVHLGGRYGVPTLDQLADDERRQWRLRRKPPSP
ncbi:MAG: SulP family inorganic anion transporter [Acidimicrobiaceae bacterium]|nr:SulP family inorganic anion transporter [Acidimicrobiaceae bacterium]